MTTTDTDTTPTTPRLADNRDEIVSITVRLTLMALARGDAAGASQALLGVNWDPELRDLVALKLASTAHAALLAFASVLGQSEERAIETVLVALSHP